MVPTLRAEQLAAPVKQLLGDIEHLLRPQAFDPAIADMTISIASTDYALRAQAPNIRVAVQPVDAQQLPGQLERGDIDMALVTPDSTAPGLHAAALFEERYVCVMRADHPDASGKTLTLERFCALDHVLGYRRWSVRRLSVTRYASPNNTNHPGARYNAWRVSSLSVSNTSTPAKKARVTLHINLPPGIL